MVLTRGIGLLHYPTTTRALSTKISVLRLSLLKAVAKLPFIQVYEGSMFKKRKISGWSIKSSADGRGLDPLADSSDGRTRLLKTIQNLRRRLNSRIQELRKDLPKKFLFFLVGFYCATAFATVIGQTGDWDILSAAVAVAVVEGIGALMYKLSLPSLNQARSIIVMFNYWKAGLKLGLFLDSFNTTITALSSKRKKNGNPLLSWQGMRIEPSIACFDGEESNCDDFIIVTPSSTMRPAKSRQRPKDSTTSICPFTRVPFI